MKEVYEETRNICDRIATKLYNAINQFWMHGTKNNVFGVTNEVKAEELENTALILETIASTGYAEDEDWKHIKYAIRVNNELGLAKECKKKNV